MTSVRPALLSDANAIARVHIRAWQHTYAHLVEPGELDDISIDSRAARWETVMGDERTGVWVAEQGGEIVGFASAGARRDHDFPRPLELEAIYLLEEFHGSGLGQQLLDAAIGESPAFLHVADGNPRATRFYERNGFAFDGVAETYPLVRTPITSLRMVR
jgi:ribosomal protein S18 acetylase RimI-like enzyme